MHGWLQSAPTGILVQMQLWSSAAFYHTMAFKFVSDTQRPYEAFFASLEESEEPVGQTMATATWVEESLNR